MKSRFLLFFLFTSVSTIAYGQTGEYELHEILDSVDNELNLNYNELKDKSDSINRQALIKSQNAWLQFREANCNFKSEHDHGGIIANKMKIDCEIQMTEERIKELRSIIEEGL